jgi:hypothetical protein
MCGGGKEENPQCVETRTRGLREVDYLIDMAVYVSISSERMLMITVCGLDIASI